VPDEHIELKWSLLMVDPGQTFDVAIGVDAATDVEPAVAEFHRRNEEARLIEARLQEPLVRGVRLTAIGHVDPLTSPSLGAGTGTPTEVGRRRMWVGEWHDVPVIDAATFLPGMTVVGPAALTSPFTTLVLRPGDVCTANDEGDLLVEVEGSG
jgi:N-methylhydantoinase A